MSKQAFLSAPSKVCRLFREWLSITVPNLIDFKGSTNKEFNSPSFMKLRLSHTEDLKITMSLIDKLDKATRTLYSKNSLKLDFVDDRHLENDKIGLLSLLFLSKYKKEIENIVKNGDSAKSVAKFI